MLTTNVIRRTFLIRHGKAKGTAFAIDRESKQYLVTARHLTLGVASGDEIDIFHEDHWKRVSVDLVGIGTDEVDVTVLASSVQLAPLYPLKAGTAGLVYGQRVYFVGFPFGWTAGGEEMNQEFPIPFAKAGIVSAINFDSPSRLYLDAHGNRGFSGGPVIFVPQERRGEEYQVAGVVSHYPTPLLEPIVDKHGDPILNEEKPVGFFRENPGIVVAFQIKHATELIDANPIGYRLPQED